MYRKVMTFVVCVCLLAVSTPLNAFSEGNASIKASEDAIDSDILDIASITVVAPKSVNDLLEQYKFSSKTGHGFAAERGNNLIESIIGKNTKVVGDNNIKNGPDRMITNRNGSIIFIQDKYYSNAKASINACFDESGVFRYVDGNGNPMIIEVPSDQYAEAIEVMKSKIVEGKIPGISNPDEADTLVKKGALSYKQAKNLAKAGTIESLTYDAIHGTINATCAFGISTVVNYAVNRMNGKDRDTAIKAALADGLKSGVLVLGSSVIAGQLSKTGAVKLFESSSEAVVRALGNKFAKVIIKSTGEKAIESGMGTSSQALTKNAAKILRANALVASVTTIVFTAPDAVELFRGRISRKQFVKDFSVTAITVAGGTAGGILGGAAGNFVVPGAGTVPGTIAGSLVLGVTSAWVADKVSDFVVDDDADEMYEIIQDEYVQLCEDYVVSENEADEIVDEISDKLNKKVLKDMYQSKDREEFVEQLLVPVFESKVSERETLKMPTKDEMRAILLEQLAGTLLIH